LPSQSRTLCSVSTIAGNWFCRKRPPRRRPTTVSVFSRERLPGQLQHKLKEYVLARVDLYHMPHDFRVWKSAEYFSSAQQQVVASQKRNLWDAAVASCPRNNFQPACSLVLPALGSLFEVARLRAGASEKHPPRIIYFMLFGLGLGCSLLAGFGMAAAAARSWVHMALFAGTLTFALYIVTDMEYPRLGLIRIESFDHFLADTLEQMH